MNNRTLIIKDYTQVELAQQETITVVYCRLSNDDKNANESDLIANQKKILKEVVEKEQLVNPIYFVDDGITGTSLSYRPAISKAIELVKAGKVKNFIVKDLSRLARNYLDSGKLIEITFSENNVRFIAVSDGFDSNKQSDNDTNLLPLRNLFNEWFARDTSKKIRAVKQAKAKAGEQMTSHAICAFEKNGKNLDHYKCSKYARTSDRCENPHYIRNSDLEEIVLAELNQLLKVIDFDEQDFLKKLEKKFQLESNKKTNHQRQKLLADERRYEEIDRIIQRLYEDNLSGKLTDERFMKMSQTYEEEQTQLNDTISSVKEKLSKQKNQGLDVSRFMDRVKKYTQLEKLSVKIVNELIDKIIIHKPEGTKRNRLITIDIHYNFIGNLKA